jgi:hypothetical protein
MSFMGLLVGMVLASGLLSACMWPLKYFQDEIRAASASVTDTTRKVLMTIACIWVFGPALVVLVWCATTIK